ncbi:MAG: DUF3050 domain-containing protein [Planctomycetaceae bacterium]|nr:DUF3050 domain-containing protein [Planctomycetaceae bacterium]
MSGSFRSTSDLPAAPAEPEPASTVDPLENPQLESLREQLLAHPIYAETASLPRLQNFMRNHVFAVWDFMSLLKRLQHDLAGCQIPWQPPADADLARFLNEIVLAEECDSNGAGGYSSHFELYLEAMEQLGAETTDMRRFLERLAAGQPVDAAFAGLQVAPETVEFVTANLKLATHGGTHEVAAAFCCGREDIIPEMFQRLSVSLAGQGRNVSRLQYYLDRHIELDGDTHGPLSRRLVLSLCGDDPARLTEASAAARAAVQLRIRLWDGIHRQAMRLP